MKLPFSCRKICGNYQ